MSITSQKPVLLSSSDSGAYDSDFVTNIANPTLAGYSTPGSSINIYISGVKESSIIGATTADKETGYWSYRLSTSEAFQEDGIYSISVSEVLESGEETIRSGSVDIQIDRTAPETRDDLTSITIDRRIQDSGDIYERANTDDSRLFFSLDSISSAYRRILDINEVSGAISLLVPASELNDDLITFDVKIEDLAGNTSRERYAINVVNDLSASSKDIWVFQVGGRSHDSITMLDIGASGEILATGWVSGVLKLGQKMLDAGGQMNIFSALITTSPEYDWIALPSKSISSNIAIMSNRTAHGDILDDGSSVVAGSFRQEAVLGSLYLESDSLLLDSLVAKVNENGKYIWAQNLNLNYSNITGLLAADDGIIVAGKAEGKINEVSLDQGSAFLSKLDASGEHQWVSRIQAVEPGSTAIINSLSATHNNSIIAIGDFSGTISAGRSLVTSRQGIFAVQIDLNGNITLVESISGRVTVNALAILPDGAMIIGGSFYDRVAFGDNELASEGNSDGFISKISAIGDVAWATRVGASGYDAINDITVSNDGTIFVAGRIGSRALVASLDSDGSSKWSTLISGTGSSIGNSIVLKDNTDVIAAGSFTWQLLVGDESNQRIQSRGETDGFMIQIGFDGEIRPFEALSSTRRYRINSSSSTISYRPGAQILIPLVYSSSSSGDDLPDLGVVIHYSSNRLSRLSANNGITNLLEHSSVLSNSAADDIDDSDLNPLTDETIKLSWTPVDNSLFDNSQTAQIATVNFDTSSNAYDPVTGAPVTTTVNFTAAETASNYGFEGTPVTLVPEAFHLDIDGDGKTTALGDGLMVIRKLFGSAFAGDALTNKAASANATVDTEAMHHWLEAGIASGKLDVDQDGKTTALGDGLMIIRHMFGTAFAGDALIDKAISNSSPYAGQSNAADLVSQNIDALKGIAL